MKKCFPGFYPLDIELDIFSDDLTIILDADALLDLFRMPPDVAGLYLKILEDEKIKEHLWLPYDVAWKFHQCVNKEILRQIDNINSVLSNLTLCKVGLGEKRAYPYLTVNTWDRLSTCINKINAECQVERNKLQDSLKDCEIKKRINSLFEEADTKIGTQYSEAELDTIYEEGKERYKESLPPGEDLGHTSNMRIRHHNLVVWKQILAKAKEKSGSSRFLYVTGKITDDWYYIVGGKNISTRHELQNEFCDMIRKEHPSATPFFVCYSSISFVREFAKKRTRQKDSIDRLIKHLAENTEAYSTPSRYMENNQTMKSNNSTNG